MDRQYPTPIDTTYLASKMCSWTVGHTVHYYEQVESTMPLARALVSAHSAQGKPGSPQAQVSGTVIVAEEQLAGRGRRQRTWQTPYGTAVLTAFVLCPPHLPINIAQLPMISGLATVHAIADVAPSLRARLALKWPNDVLIKELSTHSGSTETSDSNGSLGICKVAGMLVETAFENHRATHAILGIGINANQEKAQLPVIEPGALSPTSIRLALGHPVDRTQLLVALCNQLSLYIDRLTPGRNQTEDSATHAADGVHAEWRSLLHTLGQRVTVHPTAQGQSPLVGTALDVTADGSLVVVDATGTHHTFAAGDVSLRGDVIH